MVVPLIAPDVAVMAEVPGARVEAKPEELIVATLAVDEFQVTVPLKFCVLASEYVPVAVNCCVRPLVIAGLSGVTAMETSVGAGVACPPTL